MNENYFICSFLFAFDMELLLFILVNTNYGVP